MNLNAIDQYISAQPEPQKGILHAVRRLILQTAPELEESLKWGMPNYGLKKNVCYLAAQPNHVNFGFCEATLLNDPENLLEGTGAKMRHIKLRSLADIQESSFAGLLLQAVELAQAKPAKKKVTQVK